MLSLSNRFSTSTMLGTSRWRVPGASLDLNFQDNQFYALGSKTFTDIPGATVSGGVNGTVVRDGVIVPATEQNLLTYSEDFTNAAWLKLNSASVTGNQAAAPDGQMTADLIDLSNTSGSTSNGSRVFQSNLSLTDGVAYTFSFWARSVSGSGTFPCAWWHGTNYVKSYASLTEEWQRFSVTFTAPTGVTNDIVGFTRRGDTHTETLDQAYIWGAQLREARYSDTYVPTTSAAITRAAPRIGDLTRVITRLSTYPQDQTNWVATAGATITTLDRVDGFERRRVASGGADWHGQSISMGEALSGGEVRWVRARYEAGTSDSVRVIYRNGTTATETRITGAPGDLSVWQQAAGDASQLQNISLGGGVYEVVFAVTVAAASTAPSVRVGPNSVTVGEDVILHGAQVTDAPSDWIFTNPSGTSSVVEKTGRGLLVEGAATNLLTWSEDFTNAAWSTTRSSVTADVEDAPDGTFTADKLVEDTSASSSHYVRQPATITSGVSASASVYAKAGERDSFQLWMTGSTVFDRVQAEFDLSLGSISVAANNVRGAANASAVIENVGNGWYRCTVSGDISGETTYQLWVVLSDGSTVNYTGDGSSGLYVWGAQLEEASTATSYIPTEGSSVTRTADSVTLTDLDALGLTSAVLGELDVPLDDDFTSYADQAAAETAGYTFVTATFDAANDQITNAGLYTANVRVDLDALIDGETYVASIAYSGRTQGIIRALYPYPSVTTSNFNSASGVVEFTFTHQTGNDLGVDFGGSPAFDGSVDSITIRRAEPLGGYTVVVEAVSDTFGNDEAHRIWQIGDGTNDNRVDLLHAGNNATNLFARAGGEDSVTTSDGVELEPGVAYKWAARVATDNYACSRDGGNLATDTSGVMPVVDQLILGGWHNGTFPLNGHIRRLTIIPRAVSDAELQALSS